MSVGDRMQHSVVPFIDACGLRAAFAVGAAERAPICEDSKAPREARVADLLSRITLEQKVVQLLTTWMTKVQIFDDEPTRLVRRVAHQQ